MLVLSLGTRESECEGMLQRRTSAAYRTNTANAKEIVKRGPSRLAARAEAPEVLFCAVDPVGEAELEVEVRDDEGRVAEDEGEVAACTPAPPAAAGVVRRSSEASSAIPCLTESQLRF